MLLPYAPSRFHLRVFPQQIPYTKIRISSSASREPDPRHSQRRETSQLFSSSIIPFHSQLVPLAHFSFRLLSSVRTSKLYLILFHYTESLEHLQPIPLISTFTYSIMFENLPHVRHYAKERAYTIWNYHVDVLLEYILFRLPY